MQHISSARLHPTTPAGATLPEMSELDATGRRIPNTHRPDRGSRQTSRRAAGKTVPGVEVIPLEHRLRRSSPRQKGASCTDSMIFGTKLAFNVSASSMLPFSRLMMN